MSKLIARAQEGDAQALEKLWKSTHVFAFTVARRFYTTTYADSEDLQQCAYLGFHAAVMQHTGRYRFLSLVQWCVQRECQKLLDLYGSRRQIRAESLDIPLPDGEHTAADLIVDESLPESGAALEEAELVRDVRAAVAALPERERRIVMLHWLDGLPLADTGRELGISGERVRQLEKKAFAHLRADPVIASYAPMMRRGSVRGTLAYFRNHHASSTEMDALARIKHCQDVKRQREEEQWRHWLSEQVKAGVINGSLANSILAGRRL